LKEDHIYYRGSLTKHLTSFKIPKALKLSHKELDHKLHANKIKRDREIDR